MSRYDDVNLHLLLTEFIAKFMPVYKNLKFDSLTITIELCSQRKLSIKKAYQLAYTYNWYII